MIGLLERCYFALEVLTSLEHSRTIKIGGTVVIETYRA